MNKKVRVFWGIVAMILLMSCSSTPLQTENRIELCDAAGADAIYDPVSECTFKGKYISDTFKTAKVEIEYPNGVIAASVYTLNSREILRKSEGVTWYITLKSIKDGGQADVATLFIQQKGGVKNKVKRLLD